MFHLYSTFQVHLKDIQHTLTRQRKHAPRSFKSEETLIGNLNRNVDADVIRITHAIFTSILLKTNGVSSINRVAKLVEVVKGQHSQSKVEIFLSDCLK